MEPILKWAGGKRQLLAELKEFVPVDSCKKALEKQLNESEQTDIIYVDGIAVKNVQNMTADEYARSIGATPIEETTFGKRFGWTK